MELFGKEFQQTIPYLADFNASPVAAKASVEAKWLDVIPCRAHEQIIPANVVLSRVCMACLETKTFSRALGSCHCKVDAHSQASETQGIMPEAARMDRSDRLLLEPCKIIPLWGCKMQGSSGCPGVLRERPVLLFVVNLLGMSLLDSCLGSARELAGS